MHAVEKQPYGNGNDNNLKAHLNSIYPTRL